MDGEDEILIGWERTNKNRMNFIKDIAMGATDGSTVPFALAAGLASTLASSKLVLVGVVAELAAGCIAMGLGGYMAANAEDKYISEETERLKVEFKDNLAYKRERLAEALRMVGVSEDAIDDATQNCSAEAAANFVLAHEDDAVDPIRSATTVGLSYVVAGIIPTLPYFFISNAHDALKVSIVVALFTLFVSGWAKGHLLRIGRTSEAIFTLLLGSIAAATSFALASLVHDT